jgi:hypothetical protein
MPLSVMSKHSVQSKSLIVNKKIPEFSEGAQGYKLKFE